MMERLRAGRPVYRLCRQTCAVQPAHGSRLLSGIADVIGRQLLLGFKHRIYAFRRYDIGAFEREHEWRILSVVDDHVDLLAEDASAIDYKSFAGFISARSEEHTSELQSLMRISYAVFCLKKYKNKQKDELNILSTHNIQQH